MNVARIELEAYWNTEGTSKEYWYDLEVIKQQRDFVQQNLNGVQNNLLKKGIKGEILKKVVYL